MRITDPVEANVWAVVYASVTTHLNSSELAAKKADAAVEDFRERWKTKMGLKMKERKIVGRRHDLTKLEP